MSEALQELGTHIAMKRPNAVLRFDVTLGELTLDVVPGQIVHLVDFLKADSACRFSSLVDITAIDWPGRPERFDVVYHFLSMYQNHRIRLRAACTRTRWCRRSSRCTHRPTGSSAKCSTCSASCSPATPTCAASSPTMAFAATRLRKDFPTTGYTEVRYDEVQKRVIYEPVKLVQEYRQFDFMSPWESAKYVLPGDEKKA